MCLHFPKHFYIYKLSILHQGGVQSKKCVCGLSTFKKQKPLINNKEWILRNNKLNDKHNVGIYLNWQICFFKVHEMSHQQIGTFYDMNSSRHFSFWGFPSQNINMHPQPTLKIIFAIKTLKDFYNLFLKRFGCDQLIKLWLAIIHQQKEI